MAKKKRGGSLRLAGAGRHRRRMAGGSLKQWLSKANRLLKRTRALSRGAAFLGEAGFHPSVMKTISRAAKVSGYGRKRVVRRRGGALGRGKKKTPMTPYRTRAIGY
jgi:hypothetical protein